jgi:hypothetical protein
VATHSIDFLLGLLSSGAPNLTVVRLTRAGDVNAVRVLAQDQIQQLWSDPLLASSNVLDGLFHRGVVLCEGDTDARYYSAALEAAMGDRAHDLLFTHCGGKARMPMVIRALASLDVPVAAIADLDLLREQERVTAVVTSQPNGEWPPRQTDWNVVNAAAQSLSAAPPLDEARAAIDAALETDVDPRLSKETSERIRAATKVDDGWSLLKRGGLLALPQGDPSAAGQRLVDDLREERVFLVPKGELERWHPEVAHKGPEWLNEVISRGLHAQPGEPRDFVLRVAASFDL